MTIMKEQQESKTMTDEERIASVKNKKKRISRQNVILSVVGIVLFFVIWEVIVVFHIVDTKYLTDPIAIFKLFFVKLTDPNPDGATLLVNIWSSLQVALTGFGLAVLIGVPLGWLMGWWRGIDSFVRPIFEIIRPIPPVSWIPLTIVWLGIGLPAKAFIVFFAAFVPCLINSYTGIRQTKEVLKNVARTCGASNFTVFLRVGIPSSLTMTFAGVKVAIGNAWATLVAAEMLASSSGLGYMILMGRSFARVDIVILGIVVIGVIGVAIAALLNLIEKKVMGWKNV